MDFETVSAEDFGKSLSGIGVNLLTEDVRGLAQFLTGVFGATVHRLSDDFAIIAYQGMLLQLHSDATYGAHPLHGLMPENPPRGMGVQIFLFGADPDAAARRAEAKGETVLEPPRDKPHGLREATILSREGYAFTAAVPISH